MSRIILFSIIHLLVTANCYEIEPVLVVHGGAGTISNASAAGMISGVELAARVGYLTLMTTGSALDAVEMAVNAMELDDFFNAGYGSVLNSEGNIEMDASIMDGSTLDVGCVSGIVDIMHPISIARAVMEKTPHNFLAFQGAMDFALKEGFELLPPGSLITDKALAAWKRWKESQKPSGGFGTVGAVAIDKHGNIAAATSTGGMTGKWPGRIGDTPIIGSGTYANNEFGGVSSTGHGETIMKQALAHDIFARMKYLEEDLQTACDRALKTMTERLQQTAGVIALDQHGNVGISHTSRNMAWAYQKGNSIYSGIAQK